MSDVKQWAEESLETLSKAKKTTIWQRFVGFIKIKLLWRKFKKLYKNDPLLTKGDMFCPACEAKNLTLKGVVEHIELHQKYN